MSARIDLHLLHSVLLELHGSRSWNFVEITEQHNIWVLVYFQGVAHLSTYPCEYVFSKKFRVATFVDWNVGIDRVHESSGLRVLYY